MECRRFYVRAKRKYNNTWIKGYCKFYTNPQEVMIYNPYDDINYVVNENTLGQLTLMYDKNHNEIWEGDILEDVNSNRRGKVIWDDVNAMFILLYPNKCEALTTMLPLHEVDFRRKEIIGNIYDSPELLE